MVTLGNRLFEEAVLFSLTDDGVHQLFQTLPGFAADETNFADVRILPVFRTRNRKKR